MPRSHLLLTLSLSAGALLAAGWSPAAAAPLSAHLAEARAGAARTDVTPVHGRRYYYRGVRAYYAAPAARYYAPRAYYDGGYYRSGATYYGAPGPYYATPPAYYAPPAPAYAAPAPSVQIIIVAPSAPAPYAPPAYYAPPVYSGGYYDAYYRRW
jgi:hypothetical protein